MNYEVANPDYVGYPEEQEMHDTHVYEYYLNQWFEPIYNQYWWKEQDQDSEWIKREESK